MSSSVSLPPLPAAPAPVAGSASLFPSDLAAAPSPVEGDFAAVLATETPVTPGTAAPIVVTAAVDPLSCAVQTDARSLLTMATTLTPEAVAPAADLPVVALTAEESIAADAENTDTGEASDSDDTEESGETLSAADAAQTDMVATCASWLPQPPVPMTVPPPPSALALNVAPAPTASEPTDATETACPDRPTSETAAQPSGRGSLIGTPQARAEGPVFSFRGVHGWLEAGRATSATPVEAGVDDVTAPVPASEPAPATATDQGAAEASTTAATTTPAPFDVPGFRPLPARALQALAAASAKQSAEVPANLPTTVTAAAEEISTPAEAPAHPTPPATASGKSIFLNAGAEVVAAAQGAFGTAPAKRGPVISKDDTLSSLSGAATAASAAIGAASTHVVPFPVTEAQRTEATAAPTPAATIAVIEEVVEVSEVLRNLGPTSVEVEIPVDGGHVAVRLETRDGVVHAVFRAPTAEWKDALEQQWPATTSSNGRETAVRFTDPVFSQAGNNAWQQGAGYQQRRRARALIEAEGVSTRGGRPALPGVVHASFRDTVNRLQALA